MHAIADAAATLGSRFTLIFDPHDHCLFQNAYGDFREQPLELLVGVKTPEGRLWALPFTSRQQHFPFVEQFDTLTTIEYRGVHPELFIELRMKVRAPFYPRNVGISTAPFYYVDLEVRPLKQLRWEEPENPLKTGDLVFELDGDGVEFARCEDGFQYCFTSHSPPAGEGEDLDARVENWVETRDGEPAGGSGLRKRFDLREAPVGRMGLLWSNWQPEPVLEVFDEKTRFRYLSVFESREEMVSWALEERPRIERRCTLLDAAVTEWSLGVDASNLAALALHSFLADTWWTTREGGGDWFSVWEGSCLYHSTVDVEYNDALLYFALWPELLEMLLQEWPQFMVEGTEVLGAEGETCSFLCHDMGERHVVGSQAYPHHMPVEETADYLLLLCAWASFTGKLEEAAEKIPLARRLAEFIVACDTSGDGIPDRGTANTIDDASPALQYGRRQVYLAVKSHAALWALAELEQACEAPDSKAERWRAFASKGVKTMEDEGWLGDHYAVTLDRTTEGLTDPWSGEELEPGELEGWDACSIYTTNGLLYLFLSCSKMPRWKMNRFARDVEIAHRRTATPYGGRHSSAADRTVWFSQNMWRDYTAAYLGIDLLNNVERYWSYQATTGDNWRPSLYYDTTETNNLNFYPRGATVFGMPMAAAGLRLSRADGELSLSPVRSTLRVPLLPLADWEQMRIPVLRVRRREGVALARISESDLLDGLTLTVMGAELEPE